MFRQFPLLNKKYRCFLATFERQSLILLLGKNSPGLSLFSIYHHSYERPLPMRLLIADSQSLYSGKTDRLSGTVIAAGFFECEKIERSQNAPSSALCYCYFLQVLRMRDSFSSQPECWMDCSYFFRSFELRVMAIIL